MSPTPNVQSRRALQVKFGLELLGLPYLWWAKGDQFGLQLDGRFTKAPVPTDQFYPRGFAYDCSGFYGTTVLRAGGPDLLWGWNTDAYWNRLTPVREEVAEPGDAVLYGGKRDDDVDHIMMVLARIRETGELIVIGASGGDRSTTSLQRAREQKAKVKVYTTHLYRPDFRGIRRSPVADMPRAA